MTKLSMGYAAGYGTYLKVMVNDTDDPVTTPDDAYEKYRFNSRTSKIGYVYDIYATGWDTTEFPFGGSSSVRQFFRPVGSNLNTCEKFVMCWRIGDDVRRMYMYYFITRIYGSFGPAASVPWVEGRAKPRSTTRWPGPRVTFASSGNWGSSSAGFWQGNPSAFGFMKPNNNTVLTTGGDAAVNAPVFGFIMETATDVIVTIWDIPMNAEPLSYPEGTPASGQRFLLISPSIVKIARPGYDVDTAAGRELLVSSDRVPAKIVAAGDIAVPASSFVDIASPIPLSSLSYIDYHVHRTGDRLTHPPALDGDGFNTGDRIDLTYEIFSNYVRLYNAENHSLTVRYLLLTADGSEPTSGGIKVLFKDNDGSTDYIQLKRPGSSDTAPSASDILLDSRFAYLPIIAEGYIPYTDFTESPTHTRFGNNAKTISFANNGFKPFVKYSVVYNSGDGMTYGQQPITKLMWTSSSTVYNRRQSRDGTVAIITDTSVKFHMARDNPTNMDVTEGGSFVAETHSPQPIGIRYYIFAIPNSL